LNLCWEWNKDFLDALPWNTVQPQLKLNLAQHRNGQTVAEEFHPLSKRFEGEFEWVETIKEQETVSEINETDYSDITTKFVHRVWNDGVETTQNTYHTIPNSLMEKQHAYPDEKIVSQGIAWSPSVCIHLHYVKPWKTVNITQQIDSAKPYQFLIELVACIGIALFLFNYFMPKPGSQRIFLGQTMTLKEQHQRIENNKNDDWDDLVGPISAPAARPNHV